MNCRDAREQLDAARPGPVDRGRAEFAPALLHVADCPGCRQMVEGRERFDRKVGWAMRDVAVPAGLKSRILDSLQAAGPKAVTAERGASRQETSPLGRSRTRRWMLAAAGSVAVALLAALAVQFWPTSRQPEPLLTLADLREQATLTDLQDLEPFDGNFAAKPPNGIWNQPGVEIDTRAKGDLPDENGYHRVALYEFRLRPPNGGQSVRGVLLAIPKHRLDDPPSRSMPVFEDRAENYARRATGTYHSFAWQSGDFVYVCFVPKEALPILQQVVSGRNA